jgi:hypothetical protein
MSGPLLLDKVGQFGSDQLVAVNVSRQSSLRALEASLKTQPLKTGGFRVTLTRGGLDAEEQIHRTPDHINRVRTPQQPRLIPQCLN